MSTAPQRYVAASLPWDATRGCVASLQPAEDGPVVLFADVEPALRSTDRLEWLLPIVDGCDDETANRRTAALAGGIIAGLTGLALVDAAMLACPE